MRLKNVVFLLQLMSDIISKDRTLGKMIFIRYASLCQQAHCNRNPETRQKLCGAVRWYRAAVVKRLWRRRLIPETRVRSPVATHLLTSLNLSVSSLAPDSNWIPVTLVAEDGLEARAGCRALGRRIV